ncbi:VOC family protein [Flagellimonas sp. CMM7]|uniref:VOC family protein n=1 Tax=Flagellimonas sp. CMM7 TaxID=2654676 RepID=UPI0013D67F0C|nr:VOC family protein [Flagellimonas sp. CMM7]UII81058.1 VOC family protein [Flagellimonas sp. CMM7]
MRFQLYRVIFPVNDIEIADKFYSAILNQKGKRVSPGRHYFKIGQTILACYDPLADGDDQDSWKFHMNQYIYISTSELEILRKKIKKLDCKYIGEIERMPWGETLFYANDPFGNPICFVDKNTIFIGN